MIKRIALSGLLGLLIVSANSQTLFIYGKNAVSKTDFARAFNKNPNTTGDRKKALKEYLDLYINFKLKVQAALDAKLQDDPTQKYELENFKKQIAENIINEEAKISDLTQEAFQRSQKDIRLAQVFVEVTTNGDTAGSYKSIQAAYKALKDGKEFGNVAAEFSSDPATKQAEGDLGYITAFTLPYEFENAAYSLKPGSYSAPFKSNLGYHIFKNIEERKGLGRRRVAQILITFPPGSSGAEKDVAKSKADSVYQLLQSGAKFEEQVRLVSNDVSTINTDGQLTEFGIGEYSPVFENGAFALTSLNQISKPFETQYGYHILKLLEIKPVNQNLNDPDGSVAIKDKILQDNRLTKAKKALIEKRLTDIKYKALPYSQKELSVYTDSALIGKKATGLKMNDNALLFSFAKQNIRAADWAKFVKATRSAPGSELAAKSYTDLMKEYINITAGEYYRNHLEEYSREYKQQIQEFKEANLLFGIMDKNVWGKANVDTAGLLSFYNIHRSKYQWAPSAQALIITCANEQLVAEIQQKLKSNVRDWRAITEGYGSQVTADSGRYELSQLPVPERTDFQSAMATAPVKNQGDDTYTFNYIIQVFRNQEQRSFDDARGMIISDYQQVLEDRWVKELKKKYPVKVNEVVFKGIK